MDQGSKQNNKAPTCRTSKSGKPKEKGVRHPCFQDILDDLCSRFILNCPQEELSSFERICFQLEQAHWFYEDEYRNGDPSLPKFHTKEFVETVFHQCAFLSPYAGQSSSIITSWIDYKIQVPVCGAILLTPQLDRLLLVKGFGTRSSWGFPKGKINKDEDPIDCCIREVYEEIGFHLDGLINDADRIDITSGEHQQKVRLYVVPNISPSIMFSPQTKGEIADIKWHEIASLPSNYNKPDQAASRKEVNKYFMVIPFIPKLKKWIREFKKQSKQAAAPPSPVTTLRTPTKKTTLQNLQSFSPQAPRANHSPNQPRREPEGEEPDTYPVILQPDFEADVEIEIPDSHPPRSGTNFFEDDQNQMDPTPDFGLKDGHHPFQTFKLDLKAVLSAKPRQK